MSPSRCRLSFSAFLPPLLSLAVPLCTFPRNFGWACCLERLLDKPEECQKPQSPLLLKKYRNTPPIYIAIRLQFVLQCFWCPYALGKGKYCQYSCHLYRSTPPICIAIRFPFVSQYFGKILVVVVTGMFLNKCSDESMRWMKEIKSHEDSSLSCVFIVSFYVVRWALRH